VLLALLSIVRVPSLLPNPVGENVTLTVHSDLGPIVAPQSFTIAKSPLVSILENVTVVVLLLL